MENQKNYTLSIQTFKKKKDIEQLVSMSFFLLNYRETKAKALFLYSVLGVLYLYL